ncbi:TPA: hypothetical protein ACV20N_002509 [Acinetobacter baumannii]
MNITNFFRKFADTYKETYEREEKLLMEKQREQINSLKISVSMSENLNEKDLLELAHKYVTFVEDIPTHHSHEITSEVVQEHQIIQWLTTEEVLSNCVYGVSTEDSSRWHSLTPETSTVTPKSYGQKWASSIPVKAHIKKKKVL